MIHVLVIVAIDERMGKAKTIKAPPTFVGGGPELRLFEFVIFFSDLIFLKF